MNAEAEIDLIFKKILKELEDDYEFYFSEDAVAEMKIVMRKYMSPLLDFENYRQLRIAELRAQLAVLTAEPMAVSHKDLPYPQRLAFEMMRFATSSCEKTQDIKYSEIMAALKVFFTDEQIEVVRKLLIDE